MYSMNIIIYGTKKCQGTKKAIRFFQERRIEAQFRDLSEKPLTEGELKNLAQGKLPDALVDTGSPRYIKKGLAFMEYDPLEEILTDNSLLMTPVIRLDKKYFVCPVVEDLPLK
jgi:arsenate reductase (glutaredoxin)